MKRLIKKFVPFIVLISMMATASTAFAAPDKATTTAYQALLSESNKAKQAERFTAFVQDNAKYVGTQSYCGRVGKWLAFVDIYGVYENGNLKSFLLRQATVQHNARSLPENTESATLTINDVSKTIQYKKQSLFSFSDFEVPAPSNEKELSTLTPLKLEKDVPLNINISVKSDGKTVQIPVVQDYFDFKEDLGYKRPEGKEVLEAMTSAYVDYATKNDVSAPDHTVFRLKSYVTNTTTMLRSYSWELYFIEKDKLPSPSVLVRYDCDTQKVSIAKRELKTYF